ncbi:MAG: ABC transporter permease, partial [Pyrinomonadaceae bacterium]
MSTLFNDIRFGFRTLRKRLGFTSIVVLTLALGIGANTAIFTLVNAVLLKSLPVFNPQELVLFNEDHSEGTSTGDPPKGEWSIFSYDSYQYLRNHDQTFQDICAFRSGENRLSVRQPEGQAGASAQRAQGHLVSGNYFSVLGVTAMKGRVLTPEDDKPTALPAAVISYRYWQQRLNSDNAIIGKNVLLNGTGFTIVGITPPEFFGERVRRSPDFWLPLSLQPQIELRPSYLDNQKVYWLSLMGRLKKDTSIEQAQAQVNLMLHQFLTEQAGSQLSEARQRAIQNTYVKLADGGRGISGLRFVYSKPLHMLMGIVGLVLLIACANVGSLFLARAATRKAEISLRLALGASRYRIIRQLLTESMLLAAIGGICGVLMAQWGASLLVRLVAGETPLDTHPDATVLAFTAGVSIIAGLLFGLAPAIRASKSDLTVALKEKSRTGTRRFRFGLSSALVVAQISLSMVLLTGAGLFARSLLKLQDEDVGFNRENVLLVGVDSRLAGYKPTELASVYQQLLDRLTALPGVQSVTMSSYSPMSGTSTTSDVTVQGYTPQPGERRIVEDVLIGPNYCDTLGIPLLQGRQIGPRDNAAAQKIAVVNKAFADHYFKGQNPIGRTFHFGDESEKEDPIEIVGVIGNFKSSNARNEVQAAVYRPILQLQDQSAYSVNFQIRTVNNPAGFAPAVRQAINQVDDKLPIFNVKTLHEQLQATFAEDRLLAQLVSFFGALALLLACVGLYGVMASGVVRRTNEIGIRMALGAERGDITWMVLRETLLLVLVGLALGVPVALGAARLISNQLFGLNPSDPVTLIAA